MNLLFNTVFQNQDSGWSPKKSGVVFFKTRLFSSKHIDQYDQEYVAGFVIQATGTVEFQDGLWVGNHLKAQNGLQRFRNIPGVQPGAMRTLVFLQGQTEFQSAWVRKATWCQARCRVWFSAAVAHCSKLEIVLNENDTPQNQQFLLVHILVLPKK